MTTVIKGIEINATDPPRPALDMPNNKIAGTTVIKKSKLNSISILSKVSFSMNYDEGTNITNLKI
jgi:hypothetical protein